MNKREIRTTPDKPVTAESEILLKKLNRRILIAIFLLFFVSIVLVRNTYFIRMDTGPKLSDNQYIRSLYYYRAFFMDEDLNLRANFYPPIVYLTTQIYYFLLGAGYEVGRFSMSFYMLIFLLAMFGIGYELGGAFSGAATMALAASSPYILDISVRYFLDFPCAAMVAVSLYFLLKTDKFQNRKYSLLFGLFFAFALLTKNFTVIYLFFPILWFLLPNIAKSGRSLFTFLILSIPPLFMLAGSIYYINLISKYPFNSLYVDRWLVYYLSIIFLPALMLAATAWLFERSNNTDSVDREAITGLTNFSWAFCIFTAGAMPWYFWALRANIFYYNLQKHDQCLMVERSSYLPVFRAGMFNIACFMSNSFNLASVFIVIGLIFLIIKRKELHRNLVALIGLFFSVLLLGITLHYQFRYLLPMTVFLAVLGGFWISYTGKLKPFLMAVIVGISLTSILVWTPIQPDSNLFLSHDVNTLYPKVIRAGILYPYPPDQQQIYSEDLLQYIFPKDSSGMKRILYYYFHIEDSEYIYYFQGEALKQDNIIKLVDMWRDEEMKNAEVNRGRFTERHLEAFANVDYIITLYKDENPDRALEAFHKFFPDAKFKSRTFEINDDGYFMTVSQVRR